ncbi:MAG: hypothetical protein HZB67_02625 [Candidatus Aenigmarchaeota archaeon]|nr:hypothetical protein [Candidatus Aenigmarchaeota archaeon]
MRQSQSNLLARVQGFLESKKQENSNTGFQQASQIKTEGIKEDPRQKTEDTRLKGLTQKEQIQRLEGFKSGIYNILVCTSIGEEGLHVAGADLAVFYEPVPSEIRSIQRRGRVGRLNIGKTITLITKNTRDEAYHWSSINKEKKMKGILYGMQNKAAFGNSGQENKKPP